MVSIGVLLGIALTLLVGLPVLSKYAVYWLFTPEIHISFETRNCPLYWFELTQTGITIRNDSNIRFVIEYEIRVNRTWEYRSEDINKLYHTQFRDGLHVHRLEEFAGREIVLAKNSARGDPLFPLSPEEESAYIEIAVYPEIELADFGLPRFFERVQLKPVVKPCQVLDDLDEFFSAHPNEKRLQQLYQTMENAVDSTGLEE